MRLLRTHIWGWIVASLLASQANAAVTLVDANDWKILMGGFVETDMTLDTTRSFNESIGSAPVALPGTLNGENGRLTFSGRNSRLSFAIMPPVQNDWKTKGYFEMDFMGYEPAVGSGVSESGFYSNPTLRMRHAYFNAEKNGWTYLVGQTWSLFGWQPYYVPSILSVSPGPGILYQRTLQASVIKAFSAGENGTLQTGLAIARPTQRDSTMPNIDIGVRYALNSRRSGFSTSSGDAKAEPLSIGLSGTFRQFSYADEASVYTQMSKTNGSAVAADILIPVIASDDKEVGNTLTFTAEYSAGNGYGDQLGGWNSVPAATGGATGTSPYNYMNMDAGLGAFTSTGDFELVKLQTMSAQLQYHFAADTGMFSTLGYSEVSSNNVEDLGGSYEKSNMAFINLFKDLTTQIRVGAEYQKVTTTYTDNVSPAGATPSNDRYQVSAFFRF